MEQAKAYELSGVKKAEQGDLDEALDFFNKAIEAAPARGSGYNNRAQAKQLKMDIDGEGGGPVAFGDT